MPATFKIVLAAKADSDGLTDVRLRITKDRVVRYLNTGVAVAPKHWNPKATAEKENWIKTSHHDHSDYNDTLFSWLRRGKKLANAQPDWSADQLKATLANNDLDPTAPDFFTFCRRRLAQAQGQVDDAHRRGRGVAMLSQGTIRNRLLMLDDLAAWVGKPVPVQYFTTARIKEYEEFRIGQGNKPSTVAQRLGVLHTLIRDTIKAGLLAPDKNPMALYEYPRSRAKRVWMTQEEVQLLEQAQLSKAQHMARIVYLLQYYAHGSRIAAVLRLRWRDRAHGRLTFPVDKGTRVKDIEETSRLTELLDSLRPAHGAPDPNAYILPYLPADFDRLHPKEQHIHLTRATSKVNGGLLRAGIVLNLDKRISSHVARRTLATLSERILGGDLRQVGGLLAHTSTRTTQMYLQDMDTSTIDETARTVYEVLAGKTQVKQHPSSGVQTLPSETGQKAV